MIKAFSFLPRAILAILELIAQFLNPLHAPRKIYFDNPIKPRQEKLNSGFIT